MNLGTLAEWRAFSATRVGDLADLVAKLAAGHANVDSFGHQFSDSLSRSHTGSWQRGKARATKDPKVALDADDFRRIRDVADLEDDYLAGFLDDIEGGRYTKPDGSLDVASVQRRAGMYGQRLRGTANESFVETSRADEQFKWILGLGEHCSDCLEMASLSPFSKEELWTYPGAGDLACVTACKCHLIRVSDGRAGFRV